MFQDIGVSKDLNEQFRRHLNETLSNEPLDIDFQIQVKNNLASNNESEVTDIFLTMTFRAIKSHN